MCSWAKLRWSSNGILCRVGTRLAEPRGMRRLSPGYLPPPHRTVHAVLPHTALRHRSPAGIRERGFHRSGQAVDAEPGRPLVVEAGDPVSALESVLGAGEDREAFVDVGVDLGELPRGVAVAEVVAPPAQDAVGSSTAHSNGSLA